MLYQFVVFYFALYLAHSIMAAGFFVSSRLLGIHVREVAIGTAPAFRRGILRIGVLPVTAFVRLAQSDDDGPPCDPRQRVDSKSRVARAAIALSGTVAVLLLAFALRGAAAWHSFLNGFGQFVGGVLHPPTRGAELLTGYAQVASSEGFITAAGVLAAKAAAYNFLPIPLAGVFQALMALVLPAPAGPRLDRIAQRVTHIGVFVTLGITCAWVWALIVAVKSGATPAGIAG